MAFVQQIPDQSDAVMPEEAGVDPEEPVDDDPMHQRKTQHTNSVVHWRNTYYTSKFDILDLNDCLFNTYSKYAISYIQYYI